jgi:hypothetical protein
MRLPSQLDHGDGERPSSDVSSESDATPDAASEQSDSSSEHDSDGQGYHHLLHSHQISENDSLGSTTTNESQTAIGLMLASPSQTYQQFMQSFMYLTPGS